MDPTTRSRIDYLFHREQERQRREVERREMVHFAVRAAAVVAALGGTMAVVWRVLWWMG